MSINKHLIHILLDQQFQNALLLNSGIHMYKNENKYKKQLLHGLLSSYK